MEKPKPTLSKFEVDGILKPVSEVALNIVDKLTESDIDCDLQAYNSSLLIILSENNPISKPTYNTMIEGILHPGVNVSFNEDEQIIRVAPSRN